MYFKGLFSIGIILLNTFGLHNLTKYYQRAFRYLLGIIKTAKNGLLKETLKRSLPEILVVLILSNSKSMLSNVKNALVSSTLVQ